MDLQRPLRVTLTGELSGEYVVVEERPDGSLVVAPATSKRSDSTAPRPVPHVRTTLLSGLLTRSKQAPKTSVPELLAGWGVGLRDEEQISEFLVADIDGSTGFVAVTSQRFIFVADTGRGFGVAQEHLLSAARNVGLVRHGRRHELRVTWHGAESRIGGVDADLLSRLRDHLTFGDAT
jgi:hypothetical protein